MVQKMDVFDKPLPNLQYSINAFEQLDPKEIEHSKILAGLLNPDEKHKKGNSFLKLFFDYVINMKFDENKTWVVTAEKDRYDIVIRSTDCRAHAELAQIDPSL